MRNCTEPKHHEVRSFAVTGFGRVGRQLAAPMAVPPALHSANDAVYAAPAVTGAFERPDAFQLHAAARADRARRIGELVIAAWGFLVRHLQRLRAEYGRYQQAQATYRALQGLDARTLRDIGFDHSELRSVAAQAYGFAAATGAQALRIDPGR